MTIKLTSIPVESPITAHKFYTEVLGFETKLFLPKHYLAIIVSPENPDGTGLLLEPRDNPLSKTFQEGVYKAGLPIIVFGVKDVKEEYEKLKARGVNFRKEPTRNDWGVEAVFDDTCGNLIQIHQDLG
jgi:predicted enzyme related to lactoylglutathione lyase